MVAPSYRTRTLTAELGEFLVRMIVDERGKPAVEFTRDGQVVMVLTENPACRRPAVVLLDGDDRGRAMVTLDRHGPSVVVYDADQRPVLSYNLPPG